MSPQKAMQAKLEQLEIPKKWVLVFGKEITVCCHSMKAARDWADLLSHIAHVKPPRESADEISPTNTKCEIVFKVFATIKDAEELESATSFQITGRPNTKPTA